MFKWLGAAVTDPILVAWAKTTLVAWSKTDGSLQTLALNYGLDPQDLTPSWTQRDGLVLNLFSVWWNSSGKKPTVPLSPIVGGVAVAQLTDAHVTALTTWATQKGLSAAPTPGSPAPSPGGSAAPSPPGWPATIPWPPPTPPLWPSSVPWPPLATVPGAPPQGWPQGLPWDVAKWLPPGWPTQFPFPYQLPQGWLPAPAAPATPPPAQPQPSLPPAQKQPELPPAQKQPEASAKGSITVPLIVGGVIVLGVGALLVMSKKQALLANPPKKRRAGTYDFSPLSKHGSKMLNWHGSGGDPIYAVGSYHVAGSLHPQREMVEQAERGLWRLLEETKPDPKGGSPVAFFGKKDRHELQELIQGLHKFYPWLSAK